GSRDRLEGTGAERREWAHALEKTPFTRCQWQPECALAGILECERQILAPLEEGEIVGPCRRLSAVEKILRSGTPLRGCRLHHDGPGNQGHQQKGSRPAVAYVLRH